MIPLIDQYKILTIDPGGGTSTAFQGKPFAWGGRAITPDDSLAGVVEYVKAKMPDAKRWAITGYDIGELTKGTVATLEKLAADAGAEIVGQSLVALPSAGTPDYGKAIDQLRGMKPDLIFNWVWGSDPAAFMKQYELSGMDAPVVGPDFGATTVDIAGSAFDGYMFAYDYFDAENPQNPWAAHFIDAFRDEHGTDPDYYPANYYEDLFIFWEIVQRTLAAGGDVNNGDDLQKAMLENLEFPSVYGEGDTTGTITFDGTSHSLSFRPMGLFVVEDGKPKPLAYFNIGGKDFRAL
jgi:branched-chain amino acid transport system substrate-binding protein